MASVTGQRLQHLALTAGEGHSQGSSSVIGQCHHQPTLIISTAAALEKGALVALISHRTDSGASSYFSVFYLFVCFALWLHSPSKTKVRSASFRRLTHLVLALMFLIVFQGIDALRYSAMSAMNKIAALAR